MTADRATRRTVAAILLCLFTDVLGASAIVAQVPELRVEPCFSFDVPSGHWSLEAVRRLEALGVVRVQSTARTLDACRAGAILRAASGGVGAAASSVGGVSGWSRSFDEEYPRLMAADGARPWPRVVGGSAEMGAAGWTGRAAPGTNEFPPDRTGSLALPDETAGRAAGQVSARLLSPLWAAGSVRLDQNGYSWERLEVVAGISPVTLSAGRGAVGFGYARSGGLVIGEAAPLDRVEVSLARPVRLPGFASRLGTITFETFLGRIHEDRHPGNPFLWGASGSLRPHPRITLAVHRAALFGGGEDPPRVTAGSLLNMLIGRVAGIGFENQIVAVEGVFRLPTESVLPLTAYVEWGAEDAAGAWWDVPGRIVGAYAPSIPGLPQVSAGLEYTELAESCCGNPEWYRHWSFPGSWTLGGRPLAHPLGGHGREWTVYSDVLLSRPSLHAEGAAFRRDRGLENLYVPGRAGASWGGDAALRWRITGGREIFGSVSAESGDGWSERSFLFGGRLFLR